jgi:16S rRNA (uracil1498-N3)-methyltransferase
MRFFVDTALGALPAGSELALPPDAARHAQVRRVQPGDALRLFDGSGREWPATVLRVGRREVDVRLGEGVAVDLELPLPVTLALGVPANERMDTLVEKAAELGAAAVQPLWCERSVLRASGERAAAKQAHWQGVARAACEQCGRTRVPALGAPQPLAAWLRGLPPPAEGERRVVLSLSADAAVPAAALPAGTAAVRVLSGPEGGLPPAEEAAARAAGFAPLTLGPRVLRADTAPLALLAWLALAR